MITNKSNSDLLAFVPNSAPCFDFLQADRRFRKTAWLVPHVIKHKDESELISWRCNFGYTCESECIYAAASNKKQAR